MLIIIKRFIVTFIVRCLLFSGIVLPTINGKGSDYSSTHPNLINDGDIISRLANSSADYGFNFSSYEGYDYNDSIETIDYSSYVCLNDVCYKKCCVHGHIFSTYSYSCIEAPEKFINWTPTFKSTYGVDIDVISKSIKPLPGLPYCENYTPETSAWVLLDGDLYIPKQRKRFEYNSYCIDMFHVTEDNWFEITLEDGKTYGEVALYCFETRITTTYEKVREYLHPLGFTLSCIALSFLIGFHLAIPQLRNLQGCLLVCHASSLFFSNIFMFISIVFVDDLSHGFCATIGILIHEFFLLTFLWLNVMCVDIWRVVKTSVKGIRITRTASVSIFSGVFKWYSLYAFGVSTTIVLISIIMNFLPNEILPYHFIKPDYGSGRCWMADRTLPLLAYFYVWVGLFFFINFVLIIHTAILLNRSSSAFKSLKCCKRQNSLNNVKDSKSFNDHHIDVFWNRFLMFALMATCWITELLSWKIPPLEAWAVTDILNTLQGLFLLLIFIKTSTKRDIVVKYLKSKFGKQDKKGNVSQLDTEDTPLTSSSQNAVIVPLQIMPTGTVK